jgi:hypothetical protein
MSIEGKEAGWPEAGPLKKVTKLLKLLNGLKFAQSGHPAKKAELSVLFMLQFGNRLGRSY